MKARPCIYEVMQLIGSERVTTLNRKYLEEFMKHAILLGGLSAVLALTALAAPLAANASCAERKTTGTVVGGVGGALVGNSISHGGGGAILGGLGGAVLGHEIAGGGCNRSGYSRSSNNGYDNHGRHWRRHHHDDRRYQNGAYRDPR